jgi:hypothetical protein
MRAKGLKALCTLTLNPMCHFKNPFVSMVAYGFYGTFFGFLNGALFGAAIWGVSELIGLYADEEAVLMGMIFGCLIGGISGLSYGMKYANKALNSCSSCGSMSCSGACQMPAPKKTRTFRKKKTATKKTTKKK